MLAKSKLSTFAQLVTRGDWSISSKTRSAALCGTHIGWVGFEESGEYDKEAKHEKVKRAHDLGSWDFLSIFSNFVPAVVSSSTFCLQLCPTLFQLEWHKEAEQQEKVKRAHDLIFTLGSLRTMADCLHGGYFTHIAKIDFYVMFQIFSCQLLCYSNIHWGNKLSQKISTSWLLLFLDVIANPAPAGKTLVGWLVGWLVFQIFTLRSFTLLGLISFNICIFYILHLYICLLKL